MRLFPTVISTLALVATIAATPASAQQFDLHPGLTKDEFKEFTADVGSILRFRQLGGPATPAAGWAAGIERILLAAKGEPEGPARDAFVAAADDAQRHRAAALAGELRRSGLSAESDLAGRGLKGQLKHADRIGARRVVILDADGSAQLRDMESGDQRAIDPVHAAEELGG